MNSLASKYLYINTFIHNLDPRSKLFFTIFYLIFIFLSNTILEFIILFIFLVLIVFGSKISFLYVLTGFKVILLLVVFTSVVHLVFNKTGNILISFYGYNLYSGAIRSILLIFVRFFLVASIMILFNITTSPSEITNAINKSLKFLNVFGVSVDTFSMLISISLRFIPTIAEETNRILNAQISRGANFKTGNILNKIKSFIPILLPIFISTLKRADELATAMEVRGYSPNKKRTVYKSLKYSTNDYIVYAITIILLVFILVIN